MTTFAKPLTKYGGKELHSIFHPGGYAAIGKEYRDKLGGPPFPITQDKKPMEKWFCHSADCTQWRDTDGTWRGQCAGWCCGG